MTTYVFDIDGTLTPVRSKMDPEFKYWFKYWVQDKISQGHHVAFATGSENYKTIQQVGNEIFNMVVSYNCAGNQIYDKGTLVDMRAPIFSKELIHILEKWLKTSKYDKRTGQHIEFRPGMINFSVVGRNATIEERNEYIVWDKMTDERLQIFEEINRLPEFNAVLGGDISLDITEIGYDKARIRKFIDGQIYFFCDRNTPEGNDYPLVSALFPTDKAFIVKDWKDTLKILQTL